MPTFEFGRQLKRSVNMAIVQGDASNSAPNNHSMLSNSGTAFRLRIMKGAYPTSWSDLTSATSRSTDTLIEFSNVGQAINSISTINATSNFMTINTPLVAATQSGTASWFWAYTIYTGSTLGFRWLGTSITTIGGGGDLEIDSLNIVSGTNYRISNLRIDFQSVWTY